MTLVRLASRSILRVIRDIDDGLSYVFSKIFPTQYKIQGACLKRGICCENIGVQINPRLSKLTRLKRLTIWWYEFVYNFSLKGEDEFGQVLVFRCQYVKDGKCSIYKRRPFICRNYPNPRYFGKPTFLPGCGYHLK